MLHAASLPDATRDVIEAELLRQAGAVSAASAQLGTYAVDSPDAALRVFALRVKGELFGSSGRVADALDTLGRVLVEGEAAQEHEQVALAALSRFTLLTSHRGLAESQQAFETAKRAVLKCGDRQLMASLHARVGQAHAQRSLPGVAVPELLSALALLEPEPNGAIETFVCLALSGAEYLLARNVDAARWARTAYETASVHGLQSLQAAAQANLAFLECRRGHFDKARTLASTALDAVPRVSLARGALLDTLANVALETGGIQEAEPHVREIDAIVSELSGTTILLVDSASVRSRFAVASGNMQGAIELLTAAQQAADDRGDLANWAKLRLLCAEVLCATGNSARADLDVVDVVERLQHPSAEIVGLLARVRAVLAADRGDRKRWYSEHGRAIRIFLASGDRCSAKQTARIRASVPANHWPPLGLPSTRRHRLHFELAESLAYVCALLPQPALAASETIHLLRRMKVIVDGRVIQSRTLSPDSPYAIAFGAVGDETVTLELQPKLDPTSRETIAQVFGMIGTAIAALRSGQESKKRVLSWELDVAPEGKVGLYISTEMRKLLSTIKRVAPTDLPVLIAGETGTGKEIVAQEVHELSKRSQRRFIAFNVSAVPRDMLEGQLFGYRRGAFTGAVADNKGLIREAEGGTLFIDEIGELDADLQPKLLRFLESGEIQPLGERPQHVDVRIVAATNARLEELVRAGRFREDLFYRLNVVSLTIPPLRERREEIPTLVNHFLTMHAKQAGKPIPQLTPKALECLSAYEWPGNVRQLTNELKRVVALSEDDELVDVTHLAPNVRTSTPTLPPTHGDRSYCSVWLDRPLQQIHDDIERAAITRAMERNGNNQVAVAAALGITRKGLYLKRQRLELATPP